MNSAGVGGSDVSSKRICSFPGPLPSRSTPPETSGWRTLTTTGSSNSPGRPPPFRHRVPRPLQPRVSLQPRPPSRRRRLTSRPGPPARWPRRLQDPDLFGTDLGLRSRGGPRGCRACGWLFPQEILVQEIARWLSPVRREGRRKAPTTLLGCDSDSFTSAVRLLYLHRMDTPLAVKASLTEAR
jgi:hypothetical protein